LTPGTLSMTFSEDSTVIYVHVVHIEDKEETIAKMKDTFEKAIMEVSG
jgi:multicomponent Na+:H+ antiporter subunit E